MSHKKQVRKDNREAERQAALARGFMVVYKHPNGLRAIVEVLNGLPSIMRFSEEQAKNTATNYSARYKRPYMVMPHDPNFHNKTKQATNTR